MNNDEIIIVATNYIINDINKINYGIVSDMNDNCIIAMFPIIYNINNNILLLNLEQRQNMIPIHNKILTEI